MELSKEAQKILKILPEDGSFLGGMHIRKATKMPNGKFKIAKAELKEAGLVQLGRGRGGSVARIEGVEAPAPKKKLSKNELMAKARAAKEENEKMRKGDRDHHNRLVAFCLREVRKMFPFTKENQIDVYDKGDDRPVIYVHNQKFQDEGLLAKAFAPREEAWQAWLSQR